MIENIVINLDELNIITIIVRLTLAVLLGGIVGFERNLRNRAAGLRTYILVSLGSTIAMMTNQFAVGMYSEGVVDPTRIGAQVISGIGFLGAGTILVTSRNRVKGLTTAAGLWTSAAIGLAIGIGFYSVAIIGGLTLLAIMVFLKPVKRLAQGFSQTIDLYIIIKSVDTLNGFLQLNTDLKLNILNLRLDSNLIAETQQIVYFVSIDLNNNITHKEYMDKIKSFPGIEYIEELNLG